MCLLICMGSKLSSCLTMHRILTSYRLSESFRLGGELSGFSAQLLQGGGGADVGAWLAWDGRVVLRDMLAV